MAHALSQYVAATGDVDFLAREAIDILVETARLWSDLGFWRTFDGHSLFHIHGVTGPDEYTTVVNDNLFTNVMARANLRAAVRQLRSLQQRDATAYGNAVRRLSLTEDEIDEFSRVAEAMHIPYDDAFGIHPQDDAFLEKEVWDLANTPSEMRPLLLHYHPLVIYRHQVLKQADVVLALYLQGDEFTPEQKRADFEYYDPLTTGDSTLSSVVQAIIAAEVGYGDLAVSYFKQALYVDLGDLHHNADAGVHVASVGGVWSSLVGGFGGMRDYLGTCSFDPRLPADWAFLSFPVTLRGTRVRVRIEKGTICFTVETPGADPLQVLVQGTPITVTSDAPVVVPLAPVLVLQGRPSVRDIEGSVREDGSVIRAIVPANPGIDEVIEAIPEPS